LKKIEGILPIFTGGEEEETAAVVLSVRQLGTQRRAKEGSSECGAERRRWGCIL
jgi:hypothetical protein